MKSLNNSLLVFIFIIIFQLPGVNLFAQETSLTSPLSSDLDSVNSTSDEIMKEVLLNSSPQDANVFFSDSLIGHTPLFVQNSFKHLTLKKNGYDDVKISFDDITPGKIVPMSYNGQEREKSFFEKDIFKILTAGIVVLGGTTAYFKIKADNKFEEYEFSGNSSLLDDTRKYDLISGITFTALQINFGLLLYYFLIE